MPRVLPTVAAALAMAVSGAAAAQSLPEGIYLEGRGGAVFLEDAENSGGGTSIDSEFNTGFAFGGAVGYAHSSGFRGEVAVEYRKNDADSLAINTLLGTPFGGASFSAEGDVSTVTGMVNGYFDIDLGSGFVPFIGAGIGIAHIDADVDVTVAGNNVSLTDDSDQVFAYQGIAGIAYHFTENVAASLQYSYLATTDPEFEDSGGAPFDSEYQSHNVMAGLRFTF